MLKTLISMLVALFILIGGAIYEQIYIYSTFDKLNDYFSVCYEKTEEETITEEEIATAQRFWVKTKEGLHVCIPHTEIKEVDLWLSEAVCLISQKKYEDALSRLEVAIELTEQIPKNFVVSFENIF